MKTPVCLFWAASRPVALFIGTAFLLFGGRALPVSTPASANPHPGQSQSVAIIGSPSCPSTGSLPTTGPAGELGDFTFTNLAPGSVNTANLAAFDTAVLNVCSSQMACSTGTLSAASKADLVSFVSGGRKLIIYDSECTPVDYSWLPFPFATSNPGQLGAHGTLTIVEDNILSHRSSADPHFIDAAALGSRTDAVGDMNVMTTRDAHWCLDMSGTNALNVMGPVHTYARQGAIGTPGLYIYNGLDTDYLNIEPSPPAPNGLRKIWVQELQVPLNSTLAQLPCGATVLGSGRNGLGGEGDNPGTVFAGGPVNVATGNEFNTHTDLMIPGRGAPLEFTRSYNGGDPRNGPLGYGWTFNYDMRLEIDRSNPSQTKVTRFSESGGSAVFLKNPDGSYSAPPGVFEKLVENGDQTFALTTKQQMQYSFDTNGKLTSIRDRNYNTTGVYYSTSGLLNNVCSDGRCLTFGYDTPNHITSVTEYPLGRRVVLTYDGNGDLWKVQDVKGGITTFGYDNHKLRFITDARNGSTPWENVYDSAGRVVEQHDRVGGVTCFFYGTVPVNNTTACPLPNPAPQLDQTIVVDANRHKATYTNDPVSRTSLVRDDLGGTVSRIFDNNSNVVCLIDQRQKKTGYTYDGMGNITQMIDADNTDPDPSIPGCQLKAGGKVWAFAYNTSGAALNDISSETDPLGRYTDYVYDDDGGNPSGRGNLTRVIHKTSQAGATIELTCFEPGFDGLVNAVVKSIDLNPGSSPTSPCTGNRTLFGYDQYGNLTCRVNARFSVTTTCASSAGPKQTFIYDAGGRLLFATDELTNGQRPPVGNPETGVAQCGPSGMGDGLDNDSVPDGSVDDGCPSEAYTYDAQNNVLSATDGLGNTTRSYYDPKGLPLVTTDASGTSNIYRYDASDRLVEFRERNGLPITYAYDAVGNKISETNVNRLAAAGSETAIPGACGTAGTGNGVNDDPWSDAIPDDGCPSTAYSYDELNRLASTTDALGRSTSYEYDPAFNLIKRTDGRRLITKYNPDSLNRIDRIEHRTADDVLVDEVRFTYDEVGNRTSMIDPSGTTRYGYDALNRLTCSGPNSIATPCPAGNVGYTYDDLSGGAAADYPGRRTKITYPDGKTVSYRYSADGLMTQVTDWLGKKTFYTYDDAGRLTRQQQPFATGFVYTHRKYDAADRLTCVINDRKFADPATCTTATTISKFEYALDPAGNRTQMVDLSGTHIYAYRSYGKNSLTDATGPGYHYSYDYDENGNRLFKHAADPYQSVSYSYDAADQMVSAGGATYVYDDNGNQTRRASDIFTYDHENRLVGSTIVSPPSTSSSSYNGDGLRMSHTVNGQTTNYTWDLASELPVILQDGANTYVYGLNLMSATTTGGVRTYFLYDGLGSTTNLIDDSGNTAATYGYDEFGAVNPSGGSNNWLFTGEQRDPESNLYYLRARYYDPATGRFMSQDPIPSGNLYAYAGNNPVNGIDPSGAFCPVCGAAGAIGGAAVGTVATYFGDVAEDVHHPTDLLKPGTYFPDVSWKTYLANAAQGAAVGGVCGFAFETGVACVGLATGATSLARQAYEKGTLDPRELDVCEAGVEGLFAAGGVAFAKSLFPYNVRGRYPFWHNAAFWLGKHAQREHAESLAGLPFALAGTLFSNACNSGSPASANAKE